MFTWFTKWFNKKVRLAWDEANQVSDEPIRLRGQAVRTRMIEQNGMNFTLYKAVGGHIMEYSCYDERTDESTKTLHIITADTDLGQSIAHVITYEMLKK